ncbi:MAG TPA: ParB N-terminal domain-containing protein [Spirochaetota bacterium]|nr:ParB N-terminal domain-containing protein [Spirochaetota bacterium]HSA15320.1 ParB N-terminal domain-containing protein [Spirochaetota bacterium]
MKIKISEIKVRKRIREDMGDLTELRESIRNRGLINPVVINQKRELLAGYRRLMAVRELGWKEIECRTMPTRTKVEKLCIENDENIGRKDFTEGEVLKYNEMMEYLSATGLKKIKLFLILLVKKIKAWFRKAFPRYG